MLYTCCLNHNNIGIYSADTGTLDVRFQVPTSYTIDGPSFYAGPHYAPFRVGPGGPVPGLAKPFDALTAALEKAGCVRER